MENLYLFDATGAILAFGIVFWLAGGASWLSEKTRKMKVENDLSEERLMKIKEGSGIQQD